MGIVTKIKSMFYNMSLSKWQIKIIFAIFGFILVVSVVFYTQVIVEELILREKNTIDLYAKIYQRALDPDTDPECYESKNEEIMFLFDNIMPTITFPVITTDEHDEPLQPYADYTLNVYLDTNMTNAQQGEFLQDYVMRMREEYEPLVVVDNHGNVLQKFYYTNSMLILKLQYFPIIEIFIVVIFVLIGYMAFSNIRRSEESKVWVGMAKEAAHQLGTPLSSLLGWLELLKYNKDDPESVEETSLEMVNDINRLNIIATRFSKIGSSPDMRMINLGAEIEKTCKYFEKRLPHLGRRVSILRNMTDAITVEISTELFQWVIENLLKNAAEAIEAKQGEIEILMVQIKDRVVITLSDSGKGMSPKQKRQVFHPGYTTKKRGWGLGLSLCKRIIEEYHKGKIFVKESAPGKGTTFQIEIPIGQPHL